MFIFSRKFNLKKLYCQIVNRLNSNLFVSPTKKFINNKSIRFHIYLILKKINFNILKNENCSFKLNFTYKLILKDRQYSEWF